MRKELNVHIGEVKIARHGEILKAILGSCVGIGILWRERALCGLAHCLLPEAPQKTYEIGARYVDQAVASLVVLMKIKVNHASEIEVILVGGGNITQPKAESDDGLVGSHNFAVAERELKKVGLAPTYTEKSRREGCKIIIDSMAFSYHLESIPRNIEMV